MKKLISRRAWRVLNRQTRIISRLTNVPYDIAMRQMLGGAWDHPDNIRDAQARAIKRIRHAQRGMHEG